MKHSLKSQPQTVTDCGVCEPLYITISECESVGLGHRGGVARVRTGAKELGVQRQRDCTGESFVVTKYFCVLNVMITRIIPVMQLHRDTYM